MRIPGTLVTGLVLLAALIVFHWLERRRPINPAYSGGPGQRRGYFADFVALLINGPFLSGGTKVLAYTLVASTPQLYHALGAWPWLAQFAIFLLVNDFARYWLHRWYHESDWLWRIHRVHHTVTRMDAMSVFRVHILEAIIKYGVIMLPFHFLGVDRWVIIVYTSIDIVKGVWHHANLRTEIGRFNYVFNSAELHWWHHSVEARGQRANYGSIFSIWDWLFGTAYWPRGEWPRQIGVKDMEAFPDDYVGLLTSVRYDDQQAIAAYRAPVAADSPAPARLMGESPSPKQAVPEPPHVATPG